MRKNKKSERKVERIPHEVTEGPGLGSFAGRLTDVRERHESFGLLGFTRIHGSRMHLFGSHLPYHTDCYRLTINRAVRQHSNLAYDNYFGDGQAERPNLIEVEMSATQFVAALTSLNVGVGVPCTIRHVLGEQCEPVPEDHQTEQEMIRDRFTEEMRDFTRAVTPLTDNIDAVLQKRSIGKGDREEIRDNVARIVKVLTEHAPWVMKNFTESSNRMVQAGMAEIEAFSNSLIRAAGLQALKSMSPEEMAQLMLPKAEENDDD